MDAPTGSPDAASSPDPLETLVSSAINGLPGDPQSAVAHLDRSLGDLESFRQREDYADARAVLEGVRNYFSAILEGVNQNPGKSQQLFAESERLLNRAHKFGEMARVLLDAAATDALFLSGCAALQQLDFDNAELLIRKAAQKAEYYAKNYTEEGAPANIFFLGLAKLRRSYLRFSKCSNALNRLDFMEAIGAGDSQEAQQACEMLSGLELDSMRQGNATLATVISNCLPVMQAIARVAGALLRNEPTPEVDYTALHRSLELARDAAAEGGQQALEVLRICKQMIGLLDNVQQLDLARLKPPRPDGVIRLFVMMKFDDASSIVEDALRDVFENHPYWFQIVLARDQTLLSDLLDNVKEHMRMADAFIADISDLNPNVMLEFGMAENDSRRRPLLAMLRKGSKVTPSDLKGRLYMEYQLPPADAPDRAEKLADQLRLEFQDIRAIAELQRGRGACYLSGHRLKELMAEVRVKDRDLRLTEQQKTALQQEFVSIERLETATPEEITARANVGPSLARVLAEVLHRSSQAAAS